MPGESAGQQSQRRQAKAEALRAQGQKLLARADQVDRSAEMWSRGHVGEQTVGAQLELLRVHGFDVLHDVRWPGRQQANIDHVAIGPPGILVVDAKNWSGQVTVRDGVIRQNGYSRERELDGVRRAASDVAALLQLPWALHAIPVIALAGSDAGDVQQCQDVTVVGHRFLFSWATGLPLQLTPGDVLGIASHLRSALPAASVPGPRRSRPPVATRAAREPSARERHRAAKRAAGRRMLLLRLAVLLLLLVAGPSLIAWWASHGPDVVRAVIPMPTFSAAAPTSAPSTTIFGNCSALRGAHPSGVKLRGAANSGRKVRRAPTVDDAVFRANAALDRDHDGLACELTRTNQRHQG